MMEPAAFRPTPLALAVLGLLAGGPLHPYRMQRLLKDWGKDEVINVGQRASLYAAIKRLLERGLIAVRHTEREQQYPERTVYEITDAGRTFVERWLEEMVSTPRREFPEFPAAMSFVMLLGPDRARAALAERATRLGAQLAGLEDALRQHGAGLPRVTLLETDYQRAVVTAELAWVEGVVDELRRGTLTWSEADFDSAAGDYVRD